MEEYLYFKNIKIPIYKGWFIIIITNSVNKLNKYINHHPRNLFAHAYIDNFKGAEAFIIVLNFDNKYHNITNGIIAHETVHIADFILNERGVTPDFNNDEPLTYLAEWISNETYKFIDKINFKVQLHDKKRKNS